MILALPFIYATAVLGALLMAPLVLIFCGGKKKKDTENAQQKSGAKGKDLPEPDRPRDSEIQSAKTEAGKGEAKGKGKMVTEVADPHDPQYATLTGLNSKSIFPAKQKSQAP